MSIDASALTSHTAPYDIVRKMRASILVLGPILAREGRAKVSLPGGCAIGARAVDMHIKGLEDMGATITLEEGYIHAEAPKGGLNAAKILGVDSLNSARHSVLPDRIETGTYMLAVAMTGGKVRLQNAVLEHLSSAVGLLSQTGVEVEQDNGDIVVFRDINVPLKNIDIMTEPYPGFPTDLQAQFMAMMTLADGAGMVTETIFENRFMHVPELSRMGADITVQGNSAIVRGVDKLTGAEVMATDLRASVALVMAGLVAEGTTTVNRIYHLERGYEDITGKLSACGAQIQKVAGSV